MFYNASLLLRQKPRVWGPWKRITTWNASSQLLKFSNLAKIGQIGRQRDKLMQNLLRLLADGVDASSPNKSNVMKWQRQRLYLSFDDVCISNQTWWQTWCCKVLWLLPGAEAGCEGKGVLADQVQAFLLQVILKDGIMRMVNWIICSSRTRYSAKTEGGPDLGSWHADIFGLNSLWRYCTFSPHHTSLLPQVLHKKANCSRELKNECISSVAHFRQAAYIFYPLGSVGHINFLPY